MTEEIRELKKELEEIHAYYLVSTDEVSDPNRSIELTRKLLLKVIEFLESNK